MKIRPYFKWFDFWVGWYWDRKSRTLYIGYFPMLGIKIEFGQKAPAFTLDVGMRGRIAKSHMREDGVRVIDEFVLDSVSLVKEEHLLGPNCRIREADGA